MTCVYSVQLRALELPLEQLRRAAQAAQRVLDLVREIADQPAAGLGLIEQPLFARDAQLLVQLDELEQKPVEVVDLRRRDGTAHIEAFLAPRC